MVNRAIDAGIRHGRREMIDDHCHRPEHRLNGSNFPTAPSVSLPMTVDHSTTLRLSHDSRSCLPDRAVTDMDGLLWTAPIHETPGSALTSTMDDYANPMRLQTFP